MDVLALQKQMKEQNIKTLRFVCFDILGHPHYLYIPSFKIADVLDHNIPFDGSSIPGFSTLSSSDLYLKPDWKTIQLLHLDSFPIFNVFCSIECEDGAFLHDGRYRLEQYLNDLKQEGIQNVKLGLETEFYLLNQKEKLDTSSYFDLPHTFANNFYQRLLKKLENTPIHIRSFHHEVGPGQYELNYDADSAIKTIENETILLEVLKKTAEEEKLKVIFSPKMEMGIPGSGLHMNLSIWNDQNMMFCENSISLFARYFINGVLSKAKEITLFSNTTKNSYRRLKDGLEAPRKICYGKKNRSSLIRIPMFKEAESARIEIRNVDLSCSPYYLILLILAAGLEGVKEKNLTHKELFTSAYETSLEEYDELPLSIEDAIHFTEQSIFVKKVLGESTLSSYLHAIKKQNNL